MDNLRPSLTAIALIWLLAFSLGLLQGLSSEVLARVPIFDSAYYMETCRFVYEAIFDVVYRPNQAHLSAIWPKLSKDLMVNGPVLPVSGALFYLLSHHIPGPQDTAPGAVYQALLHALNSVLVYFLALRLTASRGSAIATGLAWAVYPASLIACGWFMTEPITCFIMLGLVLSFDLWLENVKQDSSRRKIVGWSFAAAAFSSLLLLSRPALVPILFLGIVAALSTKDVRQHFNKNILVGTICGSVIGLLIFQLPWFCFSSHLMPERVPFLNLATGLNLETQGWGFLNITYKLNEDISRAKAMTEIQSTLSQHFPELVSLLLLKISRLFEFPWNDYGEQPFQIPFHMQIWYHQLILYFGAVGACLYATKEKSFIGFACMAAIMSHFIFLPFVAIPRYAFTAIPFLILFSAYLILEAVKYIQTNTMESALKLSLSLFISSGIALFILSQADILFQCLTLAIFICILSTLAIKMLITNVFTRRGYVVLGAVSLIFLSSITASVLMNSHDYPATVSTLKTSIEIKSKKPGWALLLLDSDNAIKNATIKFNDAAIGEKAKPLFLFPFENSISMLAFYNLYAGLTGTEKENFRQWRAVSIPVENINLNGANEIKISSSSPFQIYSEQGQPEGLEQIPSIKQISLQVIFLTNTQGKPDLRFPQKLSRKLSLRKSTVPGQPLILMVLGYNAASPGESKWEIF